MLDELRLHPTLVRSAIVVGRIALVGFLLLGVAYTVRLALAGGLGVQALRDRVDEFGVWAPAAFTLLFALAVVLLVPGIPLTLAAGALFGLAWGTAVSLAGATLGAVAAFFLGHALGAGFVRSLFGRRGEHFVEWSRAYGFLSVFLVRLVPGSPFNFVNYLFALTGVTMRQYAVGTLLGLLPGTFLLVAVGAALVTLRSPADLLRMPVLLPLLGLVLLSAGGVYLARRLHVPSPSEEDEA